MLIVTILFENSTAAAGSQVSQSKDFKSVSNADFSFYKQTFNGGFGK